MSTQVQQATQQSTRRAAGLVDGQLTLVEDPRIELGPDEVAVDVAAAALAPVDAATAAGVFNQLGWVTQPAQTGLGWDFSGTVRAVGDQVTRVSIGDRVAGASFGFDKSFGSFADQVIVGQQSVARLPEAISFDEGATITLNGLTAVQAIDLLGAPSGRLLVTGAAGSVGAFATRYAVKQGWQVLGLARESDRQFVESLGAQPITTLEGVSVEAVFDPAGLSESAVGAAIEGGRYVGVMPASPATSARGVDIQELMSAPNGDQLDQLVSATAAGEYPLRVAESFSLDDLAGALAAASQPGRRGRTLVHPQS